MDPLVSTSGTASVPVHVAIIMDGNGRWAKQRNLPRTVGHRNGAEAVYEALEGGGQGGTGDNPAAMQPPEAGVPTKNLV